jgi:site-specific DNA-cytosine methylase
MKHIVNQMVRREPPQVSHTLRIATDCSGIDSPIIALDLLKIPFQQVFASDIDKYAQEVITNLHSPQILYGNIMTRTSTELSRHKSIDLYVAGPPCQSFSHLYHAASGWQDERAKVFKQCVKTILQLKPRVWVLENSPNILASKNVKQWHVLRNSLVSAGYTVFEQIFRTQDYGLPQNRTRLYIIGVRKRLSPNSIAKFHESLEHLKTPLIPIRSLIPAKVQGEYVSIPPTHAWKLRECVPEANDNFLQLMGHYNDRDKCRFTSISPCIITYYTHVYSLLRSRILNGYDCAMLQGIPPHLGRYLIKNFNNNRIMRLVGNSMSVNVLCAILIAVSPFW